MWSTHTTTLPTSPLWCVLRSASHVEHVPLGGVFCLLFGVFVPGYVSSSFRFFLAGSLCLLSPLATSMDSMIWQIDDFVRFLDHLEDVNRRLGDFEQKFGDIKEIYALIEDRKVCAPLLPSSPVCVLSSRMSSHSPVASHSVY